MAYIPFGVNENDVTGRLQIGLFFWNRPFFPDSKREYTTYTHFNPSERSLKSSSKTTMKSPSHDSISHACVLFAFLLRSNVHERGGNVFLFLHRRKIQKEYYVKKLRSNTNYRLAINLIFVARMRKLDEFGRRAADTQTFARSGSPGCSEKNYLELRICMFHIFV